MHDVWEGWRRCRAGPRQVKGKQASAAATIWSGNLSREYIRGFSSGGANYPMHTGCAGRVNNKINAIACSIWLGIRILFLKIKGCLKSHDEQIAGLAGN